MKRSSLLNIWRWEVQPQLGGGEPEPEPEPDIEMSSIVSSALKQQELRNKRWRLWSRNIWGFPSVKLPNTTL